MNEFPVVNCDDDNAPSRLGDIISAALRNAVAAGDIDESDLENLDDDEIAGSILTSVQLSSETGYFEDED